MLIIFCLALIASASCFEPRIVGGTPTTIGNGTNSKLQTLTIPVIDQEECRKIYARYRLVTPNMVCVGDTIGEKDTCQGDSRGAPVYNWVQIGIVSWGAQCARVGFPGVYTRVPAIRQWITEQANV